MKSLLNQAQALDKKDTLAHVKNLFSLPADTVYLDGNSLGPLLKTVQQTVLRVVKNQWGEDLIASWNRHNWIDLPVETGEKIAPLLGAEKEQVICCDSVSINLFKVLACALQLNPGRKLLLSQEENFPTDLYAAEGLQNLLGQEHCQLITAREDELELALSDDVAVLLLTHVNFRTGKLHDIKRLTHAAHQLGIIVVWDLAHSAGVLPLSLDDWRVDFAVGCGYKYLNGGPGAPAFIYAAKRHQEKITQPLQGWMGHSAPFDFSQKYLAADGMAQFLSGTPQIISMSALHEALNLFDDLAISDIREKGIQLMNFFEFAKAKFPLLDQLTLLSPSEPALRGSQLAYAHPEAFSICQNLIASNVIADFRKPNVLRLGFSPLVLSFEDIFRCVTELNSILESKSYLSSIYSKKQKVT
ncbi:MAG: kynureninase [Pseudohongiellaceae bacterium]